MNDDPKSLKEIAKEIKAGGVRCNCDLDNWEPEHDTGHSHVCRIHKLTIAKNHTKSMKTTQDPVAAETTQIKED